MSERELDPKLLNSLEVMFGRRLQTANLAGIPRLSVQMVNTPELFSFLDQHGILSATVEPQGNIVWVSNLKRHRDSNKEVVGDNGPDVQNDSDLDDLCRVEYTGLSRKAQFCARPVNHTGDHWNAEIKFWR